MTRAGLLTSLAGPWAGHIQGAEICVAQCCTTWALAAHTHTCTPTSWYAGTRVHTWTRTHARPVPCRWGGLVRRGERLGRVCGGGDAAQGVCKQAGPFH